jgi:prevent-host-death family protein
MATFSATELKNRTGVVLDAAQKAPVCIEKQGRPFAFLISADVFEALENKYWIKMAEEASKEGFLTAKQSDAFLKKMEARVAKASKS